MRRRLSAMAAWLEARPRETSFPGLPAARADRRPLRLGLPFQHPSRSLAQELRGCCQADRREQDGVKQVNEPFDDAGCLFRSKNQADGRCCAGSRALLGLTVAPEPATINRRNASRQGPSYPSRASALSSRKTRTSRLVSWGWSQASSVPRSAENSCSPYPVAPTSLQCSRGRAPTING